MGVNKQRFRRPQQSEAGVRVRPVFEDFHLLSMEGEYEYPRHQHTNYEVILIKEGPYGCELNGEELSLSDGQVLLIKPGDWHQDHLRDGQRHYVVHFRLGAPAAGMEVPPLLNPRATPGQQICRGDYTHDMWFLSELRDEAKGGAKYSGAVQDALLEALFWRIVRGLPSEGLSAEFRQLPEAEMRREEIATVFAKFLTKNPTVNELAAALRISSRHLVTRCHELFGDSPARLLLSFKLRRADELLRYRDMRVQEVSDELGFANPFHFSRVYRRVRGFPPTMSARQKTDRT